MKVWTPKQEEDVVDLTPMIDIVFLLIVFFMTVANMITQEKVEIEMPVSENSVIPEEFGGRTTITITRDGTLYSGPLQTDLQSLTDILVREMEANPKIKVYVRADQFTEHQYVNDVMQACASIGIYNVIFAAYQSDK